jgi:hypothetical protein
MAYGGGGIPDDAAMGGKSTSGAALQAPLALETSFSYFSFFYI